MAYHLNCCGQVIHENLALVNISVVLRDYLQQSVLDSKARPDDISSSGTTQARARFFLAASTAGIVEFIEMFANSENLSLRRFQAIHEMAALEAQS